MPLSTIDQTGITSPVGPLVLTGVIDGSNASAGTVGEYVSSTVAGGSAVSLTTATIANITNISLTAGDWDVSGSIGLILGSTTSINYVAGGSTTTSAGNPSLGAVFQFGYPTGGTVIGVSGVGPIYTVPTARFSLSSTTTIYLTVQAQFSTSTCTAYGVIRARRVR